MATEANKDWEKAYFRNKWMSNLKQYGISEKDFDIRKNELSKTYGFEANDRDVIWSIFNELVTKIKELHKLKMIYFQMALFLHGEGKEFFTILQQSAKMELMQIKQEGRRKRVKISTAGERSCEACQRLKDKIFTIDEALEKMPIPNKDCKHQSGNGKPGWCRCSYLVVID